MQSDISNATLPRIARHLFQRLNDDFSKAVRSIPSHIGHASRLTALQLTACICAGILFLGYLPDPARAQSAATCITTAAFVNPQFSDTATGWSATTNPQNIFAVGDIDGDGEDVARRARLARLCEGARPARGCGLIPL